MSPLQLAASGFALLTGIVGATVTIESRYESRAEAAERHELLAADRESGELETRLEIVRIKLDKFIDISKIRPLTDSEQIELRALEAERQALLNRLSAKG